MCRCVSALALKEMKCGANISELQEFNKYLLSQKLSQKWLFHSYWEGETNGALRKEAPGLARKAGLVSEWASGVQDSLVGCRTARCTGFPSALDQPFEAATLPNSATGSCVSDQKEPANYLANWPSSRECHFLTNLLNGSSSVSKSKRLLKTTAGTLFTVSPGSHKEMTGPFQSCVQEGD